MLEITGPKGKAPCFTCSATNSHGHIFISSLADGLFCSLDHGDTWEELPTPCKNIRSLIIDSKDRLYTGFYEKGIAYSDNGGKAWTQIEHSLLQQASIFALTQKEDLIVAGGIYVSNSPNERKRVLIQSENRGKTWHVIGPEKPKNEGVYALAISSRNTLLAATATKLFTLRRENKRWNESKTGLLSVHDIVFDHRSQKTFIAAWPKIKWSDNEGKTWFECDLGLTSTRQLALCEGSKGLLFVSSHEENVILCSENEGVAWQKIARDVTLANVERIIYVPEGYLFLLTSGDGIYRSYDLGSTWEQVIKIITT